MATIQEQSPESPPNQLARCPGQPGWNAYLAYDSGSITFERLEAEQEVAVRDSIERLEDTGAPIISDGEQRRSSFATYALAERSPELGWPTTCPAPGSCSRSSPTATSGNCRG